MKYALLALLLVTFNASATNNNPPNDCGNHGNNCQPSGGTNNNEANGGNGYGGDGGSGAGVGIGVGVGVGVGLGGNGGEGGKGGAGGSGGNGYGGLGIGSGGDGGEGGSAHSGVIGSGNSHNANTAKGGDASQGQLQTSVSGSKSIAQMASENTNKVNASSANDNRSSASGNTTVTNVGGDSTLVERNVAPIYMGPLTPTNCGGSVGIGGGDRNGNGLISWTWTGEECKIRMLGDRFQALGQVDIACELYSSTKAFKNAAKRNPKLARIDCKAKPAPAPAPVLVAPELAPRIPRG